LIEGLQHYVSLLKEMGIEPPIFLMLSLLGVKGYALHYNPEFMGEAPVPIDPNT